MTRDRQAQLVGIAKRCLYPNYRQPDLVLVHGSGCTVWDAAGREYLDLSAGIAVTALGHAHPALTTALRDQSERLTHVSNYYYNEPNIRLAERLTKIAKMDRAYFCNSGTEAIEAALKLARRHFYARGEVDRVRVIAFEKSFHGRTLGALAATGQPAYREGFGPMAGVTHVPYGDLGAVREALGPDVAAILVEPIQGEGGVNPAPPGFLRQLRGVSDDSGALLIADEVQTGVGRTGDFLACQHEDVVPDVVTLAKGLGGGVPIGAMLCKAVVAGALPPGTHGSTFGGNPLASAAALAVLEAMEAENLTQRARASGEHLSRALQAVAQKHPRSAIGVRGRGLLQALALTESVQARDLVAEARDRGVLLTAAGSSALRFSPPLIVSTDDLDRGVAIVDEVLERHG